MFARRRRLLSPDGYFLFTVEAKEGDGFELGPKRRWRHSEAYLREQAGGGRACRGRTCGRLATHAKPISRFRALRSRLAAS